MIKPGSRPGGRGKSGTPFGGWRHHLYPKGSMSLDSQSSATPYSTAITDSLDSHVAGVTPVPLPPRKRGTIKYGETLLPLRISVIHEERIDEVFSLCSCCREKLRFPAGEYGFLEGCFFKAGCIRLYIDEGGVLLF